MDTLSPPVPPPAEPADPTTPQTARYQEKREAILGAAALLFNQQGVKGATLADIAGAVGLVTNSVTYYYRKKEDLATACFHRAIGALDQLTELAARESDVPQRLQVFFRHYAALLVDMEEGRHPPLVLFSDIRALPSPQTDEVFAAYNQMFRGFRELLRGPSTPDLGRDDLNARAHIVLSVVHWVRSWITRHEVSEYGRICARVADVLLHGLGAPGAAWQAAEGDESRWRLADSTGGPLEAFLRAATVLVNEQGYRGASVDKISARLNVTKGSFYHHNDNKHDLITECFERSFAVVRAALAHAEAAPGSGWARACAVARALVHYQFSADGPLLRVSATSALPDQAHRARVLRTMHRLTERMASLVVDGMVDRSVRPLDAGVAAQALVATINAAAELHRWLPTATLANVAELYVRPAMQGLLCPPAGRS